MIYRFEDELWYIVTAQHAQMLHIVLALFSVVVFVNLAGTLGPDFKILKGMNEGRKIIRNRVVVCYQLPECSYEHKGCFSVSDDGV